MRQLDRRLWKRKVQAHRLSDQSQAALRLVRRRHRVQHLRQRILRTLRLPEQTSMMKDRPYTDLDYYEDQETVRTMTESIEGAMGLLRSVQYRIDSDKYVRTKAQERIDAHPEFKEDNND